MEFRSIAYLVTTLSVSIILSSCSAGQISQTTPTTINDLKNGKDVTINLSNNLSVKDISSVSVDNQELTDDQYASTNNELVLPKLAAGKHVVKFSYKNSSTVDIPVEVRENADNTYQFNPTIENNQIGDWELGLGVSSDGKISDSQIFSKQVSNYVVINEFSGTTNYLAKDKFAQDYRNHKIGPKPAGFIDPRVEAGVANPNPNKPIAFNPDSVFFPHEKDDDDMMPKPPEGADKTKLSLSVNVPLPQDYSALKIFGIAIENRFIPDDIYSFSNGVITIKGDFLREKHDNNLMKVFLIDETGQGILLNVTPKAPILNPSNTNAAVNTSGSITVSADDLEYLVDKTTKLDLQKLQTLKQQSNLEKLLPKSPSNNRPAGERNHMVPLINDPAFTGRNENNNQGMKKVVTIDNSGEIINYSDSSDTMN